MRRVRGVITGLLCATALALPLVAPPATAPAAAADPLPPGSTGARTGVPGNIYAIGDSITTATGTAALGDEHPANSWVTGTHPSSRPDGRNGSPDVLSMRHRLGIGQGNAHNLAHNGQRMVHFDDQANQLPASAQYVVVELGGNDLCRPSVAEMTSEANYRAQFRAGLQAVTNRAPNALIFVASIPDIYNLWFLRRGSLKARTFWDNPTGFVIPCESLLQNPGSNSSGDENRRRQVRSRTIAFNNILEEECAAVLRCRFDGHGLFVRSSNRVDPFNHNSAYLPEVQWWFRDQDISHDQGTWGFLCPANFNYTGCGDHFHPSHWGQAKLALSGHLDSYQFQSDSTAPSRSITPARPPDGGGVYRSAVQVSFGGNDANGLRGQEVRVQDAAGVLGPWQQHLGIAPPLTISEVGTSYVQVRSLDDNGNLSASTTLAITIDPSQFGDVEGTVTGPTGPLSGIEVTLHDAGTEGVLATDTTGADGTYSFTGLLEADDVKVRAVDPSGVHLPEWYDDAPDHASATAIDVPGGGTATADLQLSPVPGTVAGTVTGPSGPLDGIEVTLHPTGAEGAVATTSTEADGSYEVDVAPGDYKVRFRDPTGDHLTEWHDDVADHASATAVTVVKEQTSTVDAELALTPGSIQGTVTGPNGPVEGVEVTVTPGDLSTTTGADGTFEVADLVPGAYTVTTTAQVCLTGSSDAAEVPRGGGHDTVDLAVAKPPPGPHGLSDVGAWIDDAVRWLVDACNQPPYMAGFADGTFRPADAVTRAQAVRALWRIAGEPAEDDPHGLSDVPAWVEPAVRWAVANDHMTGFGDGTFRPDDPINRAQMARLLYRLAGSPPGPFDPAHPFPDVPAWVVDAVGWMFAEGHISGINGRFEPTRSTTRGQFASQTFAVYG